MLKICIDIYLVNVLNLDRSINLSELVKEVKMAKTGYANPFRPGSGHIPPHFAGRKDEIKAFTRLLEQEAVEENLVLTGLWGVGKTTLLSQLKPAAMKKKWLWVGADLSETASLTETNVAIRIMVDLAVATSQMPLDANDGERIGIQDPKAVLGHLDYSTMGRIYEGTPGLVLDRLKAVLEFAWSVVRKHGFRGVVFAYDEAQNLTNHAAHEQHPLSVILDVFQSLQSKGAAMMLVLCGSPTLFPRLVEARTYAERMFCAMFLNELSEEEARDAILVPAKKWLSQVDAESFTTVVRETGRHPYYLQFMCREVYDALWGQLAEPASVAMRDITRKLDSVVFSERWGKATDRQRELLKTISSLEYCDREFTIQETMDASKTMPFKSFSASQINQMLAKLSDVGLVYKNKHGRYAFTVPQFGKFIGRQSLEMSSNSSTTSKKRILIPEGSIVVMKSTRTRKMTKKTSSKLPHAPQLVKDKN